MRCNDVRRGKTHTLSEWREFKIQVKNLTITHRKDMRVILESFSMVLNDGDKAALIGEEGNGKSTLLKLLYDERLVEDYAEYSGEIIKNNARIGYLAQELTEEQKAQECYEFCAQSGCVLPAVAEGACGDRGAAWAFLGYFLCGSEDGAAFRWGEGQAAACKASDGTAGCSVFRRAVQRHRH